MSNASETIFLFDYRDRIQSPLLTTESVTKWKRSGVEPLNREDALRKLAAMQRSMPTREFRIVEYNPPEPGLPDDDIPF